MADRNKNSGHATNSDRRAAALDAALAQIDKQFGKGSVMRLGEQETQKMEVIPTSSLALDIALGVGGLPRGRIIEIYGPESSGKCVTGDTIVTTDEGEKTVKEIFDNLTQKFAVTLADILEKDETVVLHLGDGELSVLNGHGNMENVGAITYNNMKKVFTVTTQTGRKIRTTDNHPLRVIKNDYASLATEQIWDISEWVTVQECPPPQETSEPGESENICYTKGIVAGDMLVTANIIDGVFTYLTEQVTSVEYSGEELTYDLVMPETHSFVANNIVSHNTTLALHAIANTQKMGGNVAFIDAEHALDPIYAEALGANIDELIISQPDTGEQALEIADTLVRSGAIDLIVVDSVAALTPRVELEGEMGQSHVGLQARLMSQALRKMTGGLNQTGTTAIFINQLREKIGVMFGCFQYDTLVNLADGGTEKIGKIVDQKLEVEVLSYNPETQKVEPKKIVNWFDNGEADEFLQFTVEKLHNDGVTRFATTRNHQISTPNGWEEAEDLRVGDEILATTHGSVGTGGDATVAPAKILDIQIQTSADSMRKFDIEVEGNHNYFVDGAMVHNSPETTTGGKALKFYASVRLDIRRIESLKDGTTVVANRTRVKVVKNKVSPPFRQAEFDIIFGEGISREGGIIDLGVEHGIVRKAGAWYTYEGDQLGQGKEKARHFLKDNPDLADEIENKILVAAGIVTEDSENAASGSEGDDPVTLN